MTGKTKKKILDGESMLVTGFEHHIKLWREMSRLIFVFLFSALAVGMVTVM